MLEKMTDTDPAVRQSLYMCLNYALNALKEHEVLPFFKIIVAHLCCGMTHINEGVQLDSLNILDIILEAFPRAFVPYSNKILEHFMDLIAKQSSKETSTSQTLKGSKVKGIPSLVSRELSVTMSTLKNRSKVLEKLYKILRIYKEFQMKKRIVGNPNEGSAEITIHNDQDTYVRLYKYSIYPPPACEADLDMWLDGANNQPSSRSDNIDNIDAFFCSVFPVLLNCWVEYEPGQLASGIIDSSSFRSSLPGMKVIVEIVDILMERLWEKSRMDHTDAFLLNNIYFKDFSNHFLRYFVLPVQFSTTAHIASTSPVKPDLLQQFAIDFNFVMAKVICNILLELANSNNHLDTKQKSKYIKQLVCFITQSLDSHTLFVGSKIDMLVLIVQDVFQLKRTSNEKESK